MLSLPMVYITHISSKYSIFETLGVNGSTNTCPILASIEYLPVFVPNIHIFAVKNEYEYEYRSGRTRENSYSRVYTRYTPWGRHGTLYIRNNTGGFASLRFPFTFGITISAMSFRPLRRELPAVGGAEEVRGTSSPCSKAGVSQGTMSEAFGVSSTAVSCLPSGAGMISLVGTC
jgi:hypothetical protein